MSVKGDGMAKALHELTFKQIEKAVDRMDNQSKIKLIERMVARPTRRERWEPLLRRIQERYEKNPISDEEIRQICEDVRRELYEKRLKAEKT